MLTIRTMTQPGALAALAFGALLGSASCGTHAPPRREPEVAQVLVPVETASAGDERGAAGFHCDGHAVGETTRVEFRVQSAARDGSTSAQTRAVYTITTEAERDRRVARAEVVLESLTTDAADRAQSAWTLGLDAGWIRLRRPFQIVREDSGWCLQDACEDTTRQEFAGAVGDTAELVALPELTEQLTDAEDVTALTLPPVLLKRMGLGAVGSERLSPIAHRRGLDFPARFVVERGTPEDDGHSEVTPTSEPLARAELLVSRSCRLQALKVELVRSGGMTQGATHRFSWSFDPLP